MEHIKSYLEVIYFSVKDVEVVCGYNISHIYVLLFGFQFVCLLIFFSLILFLMKKNEIPYF